MSTPKARGRENTMSENGPNPMIGHGALATHA